MAEIGLNINIIILELMFTCMLERRTRTCPARMFAVIRTLSVIGRIRYLDTSTRIMNGANAMGVLVGRRSLVNLFGLYIIEERRIPHHPARQIDMFVYRCAVPAIV